MKRPDYRSIVELAGWGFCAVALGMIYLPLGILVIGVALILAGVRP